ncbi:MAG: anaerobic ribonucleoside-triphosphate reductase activating protein [Bacillota bacterium]
MTHQLRLAGVVKESVVDGPGMRAVLFAQGCRHQCPGCHNPDTHSFDGGRLWAEEEILEYIGHNPLVQGVTFTGGDPFEQAEGFASLAALLQNRKMSVMTYTGYTLEYLLAHWEERTGWKELLERTDILVEGRFELDRKDLSLAYRGSTNQRVIDLTMTLHTGRLVLLSFDRAEALNIG